MVNYGINKYTYTGDIMEYKRINLDYNSLEPYIDNKTLEGQSTIESIAI